MYNWDDQKALFSSIFMLVNPPAPAILRQGSNQRNPWLIKNPSFAGLPGLKWRDTIYDIRNTNQIRD